MKQWLQHLFGVLLVCLTNLMKSCLTVKFNHSLQVVLSTEWTYQLQFYYAFCAFVLRVTAHTINRQFKNPSCQLPTGKISILAIRLESLFGEFLFTLPLTCKAFTPRHHTVASLVQSCVSSMSKSSPVSTIHLVNFVLINILSLLLNK